MISFSREPTQNLCEWPMGWLNELSWDVVDVSIAAAGLVMLPLLPDLLANLMVAVVPNSLATARVRGFSRTVRSWTNAAVRSGAVLLQCMTPAACSVGARARDIRRRVLLTHA